jgi:filamentous hemagglutinin family protein
MHKNLSGVACPLLGSLSVSGILIFSHNQVLAQVTPDSTLGDESSVVNTRDATSDSIDGGAIRGQNLFHSFEEFNVGEDRGVYFSNPEAVNNIFSRVTGNDVSNILGTLGVDGAANLFLINPNGIIFGEDASLDVQGSFAATTADGIEFGEQGFFSASNPELPNLLTINPSAYLFNQVAPGAIVNRSLAPDRTGEFVKGFQVNPGKNLAFIGGDISIDRGVVAAAGGRIDLGGLSAAGTVNLNSDGSLSFPEGVERGNVFLNNAIVDVSASSQGSGSLAVNAKNLELKEQSELNAGILSVGIGGDLSSSDTQAGNIFINATDKATLDGSSRISNSVSSGDIGKPGDVNIITNSLSLTNGSQIIASTFGVANSGTVYIKATDISADGVDDFGNNSGILSNVGEGAIGNSGGINILTANLSLTNGAIFDSSTFGGDADSKFSPRGNAGVINILAKNLSITNGSYLNATTSGEGDAGNIKINSSDGISIDGGQNSSFTGIASQVDETAKGNAGGINITTKNLSATNGGEISTDTFGEGNAGNLTINVENLIVQNSIVSALTQGIGNAGNLTVNASDSVESSGEIRNQNGKTTSPGGLFTDVGIKTQGNGGNLTIDTKRLSVSDGSKIQVSTFGEGNSGDLTIRASNIDVFETSIYNVYSTGIFAEVSQSISPDSPDIILGKGKGDAGNLTIETELLRIRDGGQVSVSTYGEGNAGILTVKASDLIEVSGKIQNDNELEISKGESFLAAEVKQGATGRGGNLKIETGDLKIANEARISVASLDKSGTAGNLLEVKANSINLDHAEISALTALGKGGNINLKIDDTLTMRNNSLISTQASINANGGNINIIADSIIAFDDSDIFAFAADGQGGNITLDTPAYFAENFTLNSLTSNPDFLDNNSRADLNATGAVSGVVSIPDISFIQNSLNNLPDNSINTDELVANSCVSLVGKRQEGKFIITGTGGLPDRPGNGSISDFATGEVRNVPSNNSGWHRGEPIVEPQGVYRLTNGKLVMSRECHSQ